MKFAPLVRDTWPQDKLQVPAGGLGSPPIDANNFGAVRREAWTLSELFTVPLVVNLRDAVFTQILPTDQDGDFWCQQVYLQNPKTDGSFLIDATLQITDLRTGRQLTFGPTGVPTHFLNNNGIFTNSKAGAGASAVYPNGFRSTGLLQQPFCFTRQGGIKLDWTLTAPTGGASDHATVIAFSGWKEYSHASGA